MATPSPNSYVFTPGVTLYAGMATPSGGTTLTTITLANTSATEQAAGFVSPMFGLPLKQGDVPAGQYPAFFLADNTPVPATIHSVTSWPDGSMKWCGVLLRVPTTVAGSGTLAITVKNGGSAPSSSARALSDFTAANLSVELTGVTNLSGVWTATLNDAITNGTAVQIADGPAGAIWRVLGDFKQSGSAHGQLVCWHYVAALQNASGGLQGTRYLGFVAQPWADVSTPTATMRTMTAALKTGATTIRSMQGSRWINPDDKSLGEVLGPEVDLSYYAGFYTAGADAKWDFVQGGGSSSTDCTVRVQHDRAYVISTRLVPSYSRTLNPSSGASISYNAMGRGSMVRNMGSTGERIDIGILPTWSVQHLMTQAAVDERAVRVNGLASGGWRQCARKKTTGQIVPMTDPSASYTGLGPIEKTWRGPVDYTFGFVNPAVNYSMWSSETEPSHRPDCNYYAYLITGEPQFLDRLVEDANGILSGAVDGSRTMNTTPPITSSNILATSAFGERDVIINGTTYKGGGYIFTSNLARVAAWGTRDIANAGAIYPDVCPAGTQVRKYFREVSEAMFTAFNTYNSLFGADWAASGIYSFDPRNDAAAPWCNGYFSNSICHQASVLATTSAATARAYIAQYWENMALNRDMASVFSFDGNIYDQSGNRVTKVPDVMLSCARSTLTFSTSTSRFTVGGSLPWQPTNGDIIAFWSNVDPDKPFASATDLQRFYVVNASGFTGQLSATPDGSPITVTNNAVVGYFFCRIQNFAPNPTIQNDTSADAYIANITGAINHHAACGDSVSTALAAANNKLLAAGTSFASDPKNAIVSTFAS